MQQEVSTIKDVGATNCQEYLGWHSLFLVCSRPGQRITAAAKDSYGEPRLQLAVFVLHHDWDMLGPGVVWLALQDLSQRAWGLAKAPESARPAVRSSTQQRSVFRWFHCEHDRLLFLTP